MENFDTEKITVSDELTFKKLLPMKLHYFLLMSGSAAIYPYIFIYGKQLNITADVVGYITSAIWCITVLSRPIIGGVTDHFNKKFKLVLISLLLMSIFTDLGLSFIPKSQLDSSSNFTTNSSMICYNNNSYRVELEMNSANCCLLSCSLNEVNSSDCGNESIPSLEHFESIPLECNKDLNTTCLDGALKNDCSNVTGSNITNNGSVGQNGILQVSLFGIFVTFFLVSQTSLESLSDAACAKNLGDEMEEFGKQRMWGTIGWAIFALAAGALNHAFSRSGSGTNYVPGFYLSIAIYTLDIFMIWKLQLKTPKSVKNIFKNVAWLLLKPRIIIFLLEVIAIGMIRGVYITYSLWFLESIGASALLLGSITSLQCFLGEIPFFYISGWIIRKIGHLNVFTMSFIAHGLRFLAYAFLVNPWWGLLIEVLQGPSFGSFYAGLTSYGKLLAPPGAEATMQGIALAGLDGIGTSVGSLISGYWVQKAGLRETMFQAGFWSIIFGMASCILNGFIMCNLVK
ncbi:major facilitator superfamily domain-containing protein 6-like isoform X2 [Argiope bruennichi]|uniref:major facilitator superfamily domain-containing protein 6-like isoform X2 n=1 Tax=Argiope bruennichi TaxID=94029 RepID=UPI002494C3C3|nr:major facilitator superfamily domain-containing protein 6-like isoform X2 [Argiope bruennichi]